MSRIISRKRVPPDFVADKAEMKRKVDPRGRMQALLAGYNRKRTMEPLNGHLDVIESSSCPPEDKSNRLTALLVNYHRKRTLNEEEDHRRPLNPQTDRVVTESDVRLPIAPISRLQTLLTNYNRKRKGDPVERQLDNDEDDTLVPTASKNRLNALLEKYNKNLRSRGEVEFEENFPSPDPIKEYDSTSLQNLNGGENSHESNCEVESRNQEQTIGPNNMIRDIPSSQKANRLQDMISAYERSRRGKDTELVTIGVENTPFECQDQPQKVGFEREEIIAEDQHLRLRNRIALYERKRRSQPVEEAVVYDQIQDQSHQLEEDPQFPMEAELLSYHMQSRIKKYHNRLRESKEINEGGKCDAEKISVAQQLREQHRLRIQNYNNRIRCGEDNWGSG